MPGRIGRLEFAAARTLGTGARLRILHQNPAQAGSFKRAVIVADGFHVGEQRDRATGTVSPTLILEEGTKDVDDPTKVVTGLLVTLAVAFDVLYGDGRVMRYRKAEGNPPTTTARRWVVNLTAAFGDRSPVV
jgi:hypothetical protein